MMKNIENWRCQHWFLAKLTAGGIVLLMIALFSSRAEAAFSVCNDTDKLHSVALGYKKPDGWTSQGWWNLNPAECAELVDGDLKNRYFYFTSIVAETVFEGQGYYFCTDKEPFTIVGDDQCTQRGYVRSDFRQIDTGDAVSHTLRLTRDKTDEVGIRFVPAEPGFYGDPITITGVFDGCRLIEDGMLSCAVIADSWPYLVVDDGKTQADIFDVLENLQLNTTVQFAGDLVIQGDQNKIVTMREVSTIDASAHIQIFNQLIGAWRSTDDDLNVVRFTDDSRKFEYYDGDLVEEGSFTLTNECPETAPDPDPLFIAVTSKEYGDLSCYGINTIDAESLSLFYLPRGNILSYVRDGN